jgi:hypothetical protein
MFFSEEKAEPALREPKDFYFQRSPDSPAMAWIYPRARE